MPLRFHPVPQMAGLVVVEMQVFRDARGWFMETWKASDAAKAGLPVSFAQDNHSLSVPRGVLRGLHYQVPPHAQGKLVRCLRGRIWDVAVDLRRASPTFRRWHAVELSADEPRMFWVPAGFGHGFLTLEENTEVQYKVTTEYSPAAERSIRYDDPELAIRWPIAQPLLADKDLRAPLLRDIEVPAAW